MSGASVVANLLLILLPLLSLSLSLAARVTGILMGKLPAPETELSDNLVLKGTRVTLRIAANPVTRGSRYVIDGSDTVPPPSEINAFHNVHCIKSLPFHRHS